MMFQIDPISEQPSDSATPPKSILRRKPSKRQARVTFDEQVKRTYIPMERGKTNEDALYKGRTRDAEYDEEGREIIQGNKSKHTLDSDEEEEPDHKVLNTRGVEGQEKSTINYDGDIKIMPFNMDDDLEEGDFDTAGNFVHDKKKAEELKDAWFDSVDWKKIEQKEHQEPESTKMDVDEKDSDNEEETVDKDGMNKDYIALVKLLENGETPAAAMKRIARQRPSEKEMRKLRFAAKKEGKKFVDVAGAHVDAINEYTNRIQRNGEYNILNTPKEEIQKLIKEHEKSKEAEVDTTKDDADDDSDSEATYWEYQKPDASNLVQDTTKNMMKMLESGEIAGDTLCRRVGTENFYKAERCEFELFLDL